MSAPHHKSRSEVAGFVAAQTERIKRLRAAGTLTDGEAEVAHSLLRWLDQVAGRRAAVSTAGKR